MATVSVYTLYLTATVVYTYSHCSLYLTATVVSTSQPLCLSYSKQNIYSGMCLTLQASGRGVHSSGGERAPEAVRQRSANKGRCYMCAFYPYIFTGHIISLPLTELWQKKAGLVLT